MGMRTAMSNARVLTFAVLAAAVWITATWFSVFESLNWSALDDAVGPHGFGGIAGLVVLALTLGLLVALYGELTEDDPAPETFPPE